MTARWRSPLAATADPTAQWRTVGDADIVEEAGGEADARVLAWCDLSPLPRSGAKGVMQQPPPVNGVQLTPAGVLSCRLSEDEFLFLPAADATPRELAPPAPALTARVWLPRRDSHCWLGLCGAGADEVLSLLCAVPPPLPGQLLQTRVANVSAILLCAPGACVPAYHLLADSGYALHLWEALTAVVAPRGGGVVGWRHWREIFAARCSEK